MPTVRGLPHRIDSGFQGKRGIGIVQCGCVQGGDGIHERIPSQDIRPTQQCSLQCTQYIHAGGSHREQDNEGVPAQADGDEFGPAGLGGGQFHFALAGLDSPRVQRGERVRSGGKSRKIDPKNRGAGSDRQHGLPRVQMAGGEIERTQERQVQHLGELVDGDRADGGEVLHGARRGVQVVDRHSLLRIEEGEGQYERIVEAVSGREGKARGLRLLSLRTYPYPIGVPRSDNQWRIPGRRRVFPQEIEDGRTSEPDHVQHPSQVQEDLVSADSFEGSEQTA